jgi:hypothetical protein
MCPHGKQKGWCRQCDVLGLRKYFYYKRQASLKEKNKK